MAKENSIGSQFVSVPYIIIQRADLYTAAVYGYIWSKTQLKLGVCRVSEGTIAKELGINKKTVSIRIQVLEEAGLIKIWGKSSYTQNSGKTLEITCDKYALTALEDDNSNETAYLQGLKDCDLLKVTAKKRQESLLLKVTTIKEKQPIT